MALKEAVAQELTKRAAVLCAADPQWQRLRGMLDVLEGKVALKEEATGPVEDVEEANIAREKA